MGKVIADISISLDGYVAGPNDNSENPLGVEGRRIQEWLFDLAFFEEMHGRDGGNTGADDDVLRETFERAGAVVMGRRMYDLGEPFWRDHPPFAVPVTVLTNRIQPAIDSDEDTTFTFVESVSSALRHARAAAGDADVLVGGGGSTIRQFFEAGLLDELQLHISPVVMGGGVKLFEPNDHDAIGLECARVIESPRVTHVTYRVL
ncbi:MAG: dihydrofolate reductase family protein [Solirubrobacterales bacterium]